MEANLTLLYIGNGLMGDEPLRKTLLRQLEDRGWCLREERRLPALDPDTPLELENELHHPGRYLIVADEESFTLTGRFLSTLSGQALSLTDSGFLAPAEAFEIWRESYTMQIGQALVTVVLHGGDSSYPLLSLERIGGKTWHCFPGSAGEEKSLMLALMTGGEDALEVSTLLPGWIRVRACGEERIGQVERELKPFRLRTIPHSTLVQAFIEYFSDYGKTLTFAESCTGGRLAAALTSESGSSAILEGSYVTYANRIKTGWLGVRESTLEQQGAVSAECVREMAAGAQANLGADIAVAISGIAGPTGAVPGKPVGTVFVCVRNGEQETVRRLQLSGDRNAVQEQAVRHALKMILESEENIFDFFSENS